MSKKLSEEIQSVIDLKSQTFTYSGFLTYLRILKTKVFQLEDRIEQLTLDKSALLDTAYALRHKENDTKGESNDER